ncbi:hypothetical protein GOP47_0020881 [Adiantum capillus-veneris]|uniref:Kinesin-like protein n=1 Tax=Adiantum capillus-veneris TaxID=13818 RepID=A0A9D4Z945_ADICA|nr:hypothetical protein GOP47_0020881 [Adiantum capillus-veneris]
MEKIGVAVRVRPFSSSDATTKANYWKIVDNTISLCSPLGTPVSGQAFTFDYVFGPEVGTQAIYEWHTRGVISSALHGFNGTVFAYGQTSSGKTYTMRGSKMDLGLIGLAVHEVFSHIQQMTDREFLIRVSYMEIYNEDINDLIAPENRKLQVHENLEKGIFVAGLREEIVSSPRQVFELLEFGEAHRHVGQTNMNVYSSRSHTIFRMVIESKDKNAVLAGTCSSDAVRVSVLNLVDLAGSERVAKTGAGGVRLREGTHINKSLMTLGNVIKKLSDGAAKQGGHVPYRDSKLTRILQPALGGNAKTAIICTIAPDEIHIDETRGTLLFASRAKRVTTCAQVNEIITDAALLKRQQREIEDLRKKLKGFQSEVSEQEILRLRNDLLKYELEKEKLELELQEERKAQMEREQRIREQELKIENLSSLVISSTFDDALNKENGKHLENRMVQSGHPNGLITVRRERQLSPLNFELLANRSAEKYIKRSGRELDFEGLSTFENVANEDLWATMNDGQAATEPDFLFSTPSRWTSSVGSTKGGGSSSVVGALMSSKVKMERYKCQLEEAWKENSELRAQLQDHCTFQAELQSELVKLKEEFSLIKSTKYVLEEFWDAMKETKSSFSVTIRDFLIREKDYLGSAFTKSGDERNMKLESLTNTVVKLEAELSACRAEKAELQTQCRSYAEQFQCLTANITKDGGESPEGANCIKATSQSPTKLHYDNQEPDISCEAPLDRDCGMNCEENCLPHGHVSNDEEHLHSRPRMAAQVPRLGVDTQSVQKDLSICVSDDGWLKRKGNKGDCISEDVTISGRQNNLENMTQMLLMSKGHIKELEKQVLLANLETERTKAILLQQLDMHEKSVVAMKLQKRQFAEELKSIMETIALQDNFVTSICHGIQGFDK